MRADESFAHEADVASRGTGPTGLMPESCCDDYAIEHPGARFCPRCQLVNERPSDLTYGAQ